MSQKIQKKYTFAVIATDVAIFTLEDDALKVLLIEMRKKPFTGHFALPGGLVRSSESVDKAAERLLAEKTGIRHAYMEQLYTFGKVDRDPFGRVVSVAYMALMSSRGIKLSTTKEYGGVQWYPVKHLPRLAYDHKEVIEVAVSRLKAKLGYTNVAYGMLPKEFTLSELQRVYEIILGRKLDKRNFRKKILSLRMLRDCRKQRVSGASRPARVYAFVERAPKVIHIL